MATGRTNRKRELSELFIKNAKAEAKRVLFRDTKSEGLVLRVSPTGTKTFAVMMRDGKGKPQTYTLGWYPDLSLKEARAKADQMRHEVKYEGADTPTSHMPELLEEVITLRALLAEAQPIFAVNRKGWRPRGPNSKPGNAYSTILNVFAPLLDRDVQSLAETDLAKVANAHKRARPTTGRTSANGQVSRAMSYLSPVLDWAAGRGRFEKIGAGRIPRIRAPDLRKVSDPSDADPTILGKRERVLEVGEIAAVWPLLQYPPPPELCRQNIAADDDYGPVALRFILLTLARVNEVTETCWADFDFENGVWHRVVKSTRGNGTDRIDSLPLSRTALDLLKSLPGYANHQGHELVFPNSTGGRQTNWDRVTKLVQTASRTSGWHRHDLRRSAATLLEELGVAPRVVDEILSHTEPLAREGVSKSAGHYMVATRILTDIEDPRVIALEKLAQALELIATTQQRHRAGRGCRRSQ